MSCDALIKIVGHRGLFQILYVSWMALTKIICSSQVALNIFVSYERNFSCLNDELNISSITANETECCTTAVRGMEFEESVMVTTVQSKYSLVCQAEKLVPMATTCLMIGFLIGSFVNGALSDKFGRSKMMSLLALYCLTVGLLTPFAPNYILYCFGRLLVGVGIGGVLTIANTSCVEVTIASCRLYFLMVASFCWYVGYLLLTLSAYFQRNHTYLQVIVALYSIPFLFTYFVLPEPLRWLVVRGRDQDAFKLAKTMARLNKKQSLTEDEFQKFISNKRTTVSQPRSFASDFKTQMGFLRLSNMLRISIIFWFLFIAATLVEYSFTFSIGRIDPNVFRNFLIFTAIAPAKFCVIFLMGKRLGRVPLIMVAFGLAGVLSFVLIPLYKHETYGHHAVWVAIIANFFTTIAFFVIWLYGPEVYPTEVRNTAVGSASMWGRIGGMLSPQVIYLDLYWRPLPFLIYGIVAFLAAISCFSLPETKGVPTMETLEVSEEFVKRNRIWRSQWLPEKQTDYEAIETSSML